jgi:hypothetical protein
MEDDGEGEDREIERRSAAMTEGLSHATFDRRPDAKRPPTPEDDEERNAGE